MWHATSSARQAYRTLVCISICRARLQTKCSVKACVQPPCKWAECLKSWSAHACRTCRGWGAPLRDCIVFQVRVAERVLQWRPTVFLGRYLCRELVQADGPWPSCQSRCARTHAALRRMLLEGLQAASFCCNKAGSARQCVLKGKACCVLARPVVCRPSQPHTGCSGARSA